MGGSAEEISWLDLQMLQVPDHHCPQGLNFLMVVDRLADRCYFTQWEYGGTIAATEAALKRGATVVVIATGGVLAGLCELYEHCHLIPSMGGQPPEPLWPSFPPT